MDYRGEIKVILINLSTDDFIVENGERICQMVINEYVKVEFNNVIEIDINTLRGNGGFGSTGRN